MCEVVLEPGVWGCGGRLITAAFLITRNLVGVGVSEHGTWINKEAWCLTPPCWMASSSWGQSRCRREQQSGRLLGRSPQRRPLWLHCPLWAGSGEAQEL